MRLIYIANIRLPTEKAHGIQIMKTCEALVRQGVTVELLVPKRHNIIKDDPFDFYGVEENFTIKRLWSLDWISIDVDGLIGDVDRLDWVKLSFKRWAFYVQSATFAGLTLMKVRRRLESYIYTRDLFLCLVLPKDNLFFEVHWLPEKVRWYHRRAYRRARGIVAISEGIRKDLVALGVPEEKICVARDAADAEKFRIDIAREEARKKLKLSPDEKIALYTGHLYEWKGADVLAAAAPKLPDVQIFLVGGTDEDVRGFKKNFCFPNLHIIGWQKHERIPLWLAAADVLVLPTSAKSRIGDRDTSPLKLFEYMAAHRPIVASDAPSIREVLDNETAELVKPDDPVALALGIMAALQRAELSGKRANKAYEKSLEYTWEKRAERIREFVESV